MGRHRATGRHRAPRTHRPMSSKLVDISILFAVWSAVVVTVVHFAQIVGL